MAVEISPAIDEDLPELITRFAPDQEHYFRDRLNRPDLGDLLVARLDDDPEHRIVAVVFIRFADAEEWELRERLPRVPILSHLQVLPELRRRGIATAIMAAAEARVRRRGRTRIALGVNLDNEGAYRLYRRLGYKEWRHEIINTFVEHFSATGVKTRELEKCHIMVKDVAVTPPDHRPRSRVLTSAGAA